MTEEATEIGNIDGTKVSSSVTYRYDSCGSRVEKLEDGEKTSYYYNNKNQLISRETKEDRCNYRYDYQGNLTEKTGTKERWKYHYAPLNS